MNNYKSVLSFIVTLLIITAVFWLPLVINIIPSERTKYIILIILLGIVLYEFYKDFKDKSYSTTIFIALTDITMIFLPIIIIFLKYKYCYNIIDIDIKVKINTINLILQFLFFGDIFLREFLKSDRFIKKKS